MINIKSMKKIGSLFLFFISFMNFAHAEECSKYLSDKKTPDEIEKTLQCLKDNLTELDRIFTGYEEYEKSIKQTFKDLLAGEGRCIEQQMINKTNTDSVGKLNKEELAKMAESCNQLLTLRQKDFLEQTRNFKRVTQKIKSARTMYQAKKLYAETLNSFLQRNEQYSVESKE